MPERGHQHTFSKHQIRVDFCHYVIVQRFCKDPECDEVTETAIARDFKRNPMQVAFADRDCMECRRELYGHEPPSWKTPHREGTNG